MSYVHHIPGRIRIRTQALKGNPAEAAAQADWLRSLAGVEDVAVNPLTGSVLALCFDDAPGELTLRSASGVHSSGLRR